MAAWDFRSCSSDVTVSFISWKVLTFVELLRTDCCGQACSSEGGLLEVESMTDSFKADVAEADWCTTDRCKAVDCNSWKTWRSDWCKAESDKSHGQADARNCKDTALGCLALAFCWGWGLEAWGGETILSSLSPLDCPEGWLPSCAIFR